MKTLQKQIKTLQINELKNKKIYLFKNAKSLISNLKKIKKLAIRHAELLYKNKKTLGLFEIRKHLVWYFKGFPGAAELRKKMVQVKSIREIKDILK